MMELLEAIAEIRKSNNLDNPHRWDGISTAASFILNAVADGTLIPAESVFQVRDGYMVKAYNNNRDCTGYASCNLSEALEIRSADDVRSEAMEEAAKIARTAKQRSEKAGLSHPENSESRSRMFSRSREALHIEAEILALIDNPAPPRDNTQPEPEQETTEVLRFTLTGGGFAPEKLVRDPNGDLMRYDQAHLVSQPNLREHLEQAERERDEWRDVATKCNHLSEDLARRAGFRAGIEAAAKWLETVPQELQDRQIIVRNIRALIDTPQPKGGDDE